MMKTGASFAALSSMCLALVSCAPGEAEAEFIDSLRTVLRDPGGLSRFDLNTAATFDWDVVHVFPPYTRPEVIRDAIGFDIDDRGIDMFDSFNLFVFTENGGVVLTAAVPRGVCDVQPAPADPVTQQSFGVAASAASFEVLIDDAGYCRMTPMRTIRD